MVKNDGHGVVDDALPEDNRMDPGKFLFFYQGEHRYGVGGGQGSAEHEH